MLCSKTRLWRRAVTVAAIFAATVVSACGSSGNTSPASSDAPSAGFPVTLKTGAGAVKIAHRPRRIVSLSPSATEDLFALGASTQVVAVDSDSIYPKSAPHTTLSAYHPSVEAIAKYRPDLVVITDDINHIAEQLAKLNVPVLLEPAPDNFSGAYAQLAQLGRATGNVAGARRAVDSMRGQIASLVRSVPRPKRTLTVYNELDPTGYSADSRTFVGAVYTMFGLKNIADKAGKANNYPQLSREYIVASDPGLIVLADTVCCGQTPAKVAARPSWKNITAVKNGLVIPVNDSLASEWGPQFVQFVKTIAAAVRRAEARQQG